MPCFLNRMGKTRPLFSLFSSFSQHNDKYSTKFDCKWKMHRWGAWISNPGPKGWQAQTNPLSYGGPTQAIPCCVSSDAFLSATIHFTKSYLIWRYVRCAIAAIRSKMFEWGLLVRQIGSCVYLPTQQCDQICRNIATLANVKRLCQFFEGFHCIWYNFQPTLVIFYGTRKTFMVSTAKYFLNYLSIWSHCSTQVRLTRSRDLLMTSPELLGRQESPLRRDQRDLTERWK